MAGQLDWAPLLQNGLHIPGITDGDHVSDHDDAKTSDTDDDDDAKASDTDDNSAVQSMDVCASVRSTLDEADGHAETLKRERDAYERYEAKVELLDGQISYLKELVKEKEEERTVAETKRQKKARNVFKAADHISGGLTLIRHLDGQN